LVAHGTISILRRTRRKCKKLNQVKIGRKEARLKGRLVGHPPPRKMTLSP